MKIEKANFGQDAKLRRQGELKTLIADLKQTDYRPCLNCDVRCACSASISCTCGCAPDCEHAPAKLTSDNEFPIEPGIVALTYAFSLLRHCPTCWSCEGHYGPGGEIQRLPAVWFYAHSQVFAGMVSSHVTDLLNKKRLNCRWQVSITFAAPDDVEPAYALQPDIKNTPEITIEALRQDAAVIAEGLYEGVQAQADSLLGRVDKFTDNY